MKLALIGITIGYILGFVSYITAPSPDYSSSSVVQVPRTQETQEPVPVYSVSAYNLGDVNQTDDSPCIGAWGDNLCSLLAIGKQTCANNHYPKGTILDIEGYGTCVVMDRMNSRYGKYDVDIAFPKDQKQEALN